MSSKKPISLRAEKALKARQERASKLEKERREQQSVNKSGLTDYQQQMAKLADLSYKESAATRRKWLKDTDSRLKLDNSLSSKHIATAINNDLGEVYISHKGTKLDHKNIVGDLSTDVAIALGKQKQHERFRDAEDHYDRVREAYPTHKIITVGHSLGGAVASHLAREKDVESHVFNAGSGIGAVRDSLKPKKKKGSVNWYKTDGIDILSQLGLHGADNLVEVKQTESSPHSLSNFLN